MGVVISEKELKYLVTMTDQTTREREALNRGLGQIDKTAAKASADTNRSLIQMAKQSKQAVEGINAVFQLGGWLMFITKAVQGLAKITEEARKASPAFKDLGNNTKGLMTDIGTAMVDFAEPAVESLNEFVYGARASFMHVQEIAALTADFMGKAFDKVLSWEGIKTIIIAWAEGIINMFVNIGQGIWKILKAVFDSFKDMFGTMAGFAKDFLEKVFTGKWKDIKSPAEYFKESFAKTLDNLKEIGAGAIQVATANLTGAASVARAVGSLVADEAKQYRDAVAKLITPEIQRMKEESKKAGENLNLLERNLEVLGGEKGSKARELLDELEAQAESAAKALKALRDQQARQSLSGIVNEAASGTGAGQDLLSLAADPYAYLVAKLMQFMDEVENLGMVLNPIMTIINGMFEILGPAINNILAPMAGIWKVLGYLLGVVLLPILELMRPIIEAMAAAFLWFYNDVLVPVVNFIAVGLNKAYNAFVDFINSILEAVDSIPFVDMSYRVARKDEMAGTLARLDMNGLAGAAGGSYGGSSSSVSGSSASYAAGTNITIESIEIKADFIAGDAGMTDVAIKIRDLILEAERIGR